MATLTKDINGKRTEVVYQPFADRILVMVTQLGKVGNLIQASIPSSVPLPNPNVNVNPEKPSDSLPEPSPAIQLTMLLGSTPSEHMQVLHSLYAAQIATIIWTEEEKVGSDSSRRSVVVGLALAKLDATEIEQQEKELFRGVMAMIYELLRST